MSPGQPSTGIARFKNYFLKGILAIYIIAFTSLYVQVQSLFGDNGIAPLRDFAAKQLAAATKRGSLELYNIILVAPKIGLSFGTFIELLCLVSVLIALAALFIRRLVNALTFGLLWYIYFSICAVGQGFMSFHSDLLLLEVGFITIILAPLIPTSKISHSDHDHLSFFLVKWLVFRYFVTNVFNVYLDGDDAWYQMTAIPMFAQGVQFPSALTWRIFNFSPEQVKLLHAYGHAVRLVTPFLILFDLKYTRFLAYWTLVFISLFSALYFNFGWTDLLIGVCLFSFLKDAYFSNDKRVRQSGFKLLLDVVVICGYLGLVGFILFKFFGLKYDGTTIKAQVSFTPVQFKLLVDHLVPISFLVGLLGLLSAAYTTYFQSNKKTSIIKTLVYSVIVTALFFSTFPTLSRFTPGLDNKVKSLAFTKDLSRFVAPFHLSNNYLLMSKVSQHYAGGRPELQIQGRSSADDPVWQQYDLRYKPGQPTKPVSRVVPHLPRIDLKMWYAARSSLQNNQWLQTLCYRLATKGKDVINAISPSNSVAKASLVRVVTLNYKYSNPRDSGFWAQTGFKSEYMPPTTIENLKMAVKSNGISLSQPTKLGDGVRLNSLDKLLNKYLEIASDYIRSVEPTTVIWTLAFVSAVSIFT